MSKESERQEGIDRALAGYSQADGLFESVLRSDEERQARADGFRAGQIIAAQRKALAEAEQSKQSSDDVRHEVAAREAAEIYEESARDRAEEAERAARERHEELEEAAQERADRAEEKAEELAQEIAYKANNPGDYECPACLFTTLRRGARKCPKCHDFVPEAYWKEIDAEEAEQQRLEDEQRNREAEAQRKQQLAHEAYLKSPEYLAAEAAKEAQRQAAAAAKLKADQQAQLVERRTRRADLVAILTLVCTSTFLTLILFVPLNYFLRTSHSRSSEVMYWGLGLMFLGPAMVLFLSTLGAEAVRKYIGETDFRLVAIRSAFAALLATPLALLGTIAAYSLTIHLVLILFIHSADDRLFEPDLVVVVFLSAIVAAWYGAFRLSRILFIR